MRKRIVQWIERKAFLQRFLNLPRLQKRIFSVISDSLGLLLVFWLAFALRLEDPYWLPDEAQLAVALVTVAVTILAFIKLGLYRAVIRYLGDRALLTIIYGVVASSLAVIFFGYLFQAFIPRSVPIIYGVMAFVLVSGTRMSVRMLVNRPFKLLKEPVAIVGAGSTGIQLATALLQSQKFEPVLLIAINPDHHRTSIHGLPVVGLDFLENELEKKGVQRLLLALDADAKVDRKQLLERLEPLALPVQTVPSVSEIVSGEANINDVRDLDIDDLLGREPVLSSADDITDNLRNRVVLVTGAGGSIGSELCRQILQNQPKALVLLDQSEYALYQIDQDLERIKSRKNIDVAVLALLGSVLDQSRCEAIMRGYDVDVVFHAAAYKHVPIVENNIVEGIRNNVFGTLYTAQAAVRCDVERFILISTDKAVRPTNIMGASKRVAELVLQSLSKQPSNTIFSMVRFGNVLGSSGSVVPLFREQIREGGPVTVTHPDIIRYFMTIPEASHLVLQAAAMGRGGEVFVLDMGEPVKIADLARRMISLMGLEEKSSDNPYGDIEIQYMGLRPGEKLYEELLIGGDPEQTRHPRIMMAREASLSWQHLEASLRRLADAFETADRQKILKEFRSLPIQFAHQENHGGGELPTSAQARDEMVDKLS